MPNPALHPRFAETALATALADTPVVLIHGPRQSGKTTLTQTVGGARGYAYFSFDDAVALEAATSDPVGFIADLPERAILDEVQRVPALFTAIKATVDRSFVFQELRRQASWRDDDIRFHHFRDKDGAEVDVVLERGARALAGVEVNASATVRASDFRGLRKLREAAGKRFAAGVVLYDGEASVGFGDGLHAVPIRALWEMR